MLERILLSLQILWFFAFTAIILYALSYLLIRGLHTGWQYLRSCLPRRKKSGLVITWGTGLPFRSDFASSVIIRENVTIEANVYIRPGVTIGAGATVLRNSYVRWDVPPGVTVAGSPATEVCLIRASPSEMIS